MSKPIEIKGKRNIDKLFHNEESAIRNETISDKVDPLWLEHYVQVNIINKLYLNMEFTDVKLIERDIKKKITGYKAQDLKKNIYSEKDFVNYDKVVQKLVESKLTCFYCNNNCYLIYDKVRQLNQWTLDRINNDYGHNKNNLVISCLKCNLQRRNIDKDKFLFTKQLKIKKTM